MLEIAGEGMRPLKIYLEQTFVWAKEDNWNNSLLKFSIIFKTDIEVPWYAILQIY